MSGDVRGSSDNLLEHKRSQDTRDVMSEIRVGFDHGSGWSLLIVMVPERWWKAHFLFD